MKTTTKVFLGVGIGLGVAAAGFAFYKHSRRQAAGPGAAAAVMPGGVVLPFQQNPSAAPGAALPPSQPAWAANVNAGINVAQTLFNTGLGIISQLNP
jgi:hypothetical protein